VGKAFFKNNFQIEFFTQGKCRKGLKNPFNFREIHFERNFQKKTPFSQENQEVSSPENY